MDTQSRYAAGRGRALGQADHSLPTQECLAYTHPGTLDRTWKTWPEIVHGHQCHQSPPPPQPPPPSFIMLSSHQEDSPQTKPGVIRRTQFFETEKSRFGALLGWGKGGSACGWALHWMLFLCYLIDILMSALKRQVVTFHFTGTHKWLQEMTGHPGPGLGHPFKHINLLQRLTQV